MEEHPGSRIRIVLADDAVLLREALGGALAAAGFDVVGQAADVAGLFAVVDRERPDLVIVDVRMPPTHTTEGLEAARQLRLAHPGIAILILSQYVETRYAVDLLRDDPSGIGYLLKDRVTRGGTWRKRCGGWPRVARSSTRRWCHGCSGDRAATPRSTS